MRQRSKPKRETSLAPSRRKVCPHLPFRTQPSSSAFQTSPSSFYRKQQKNGGPRTVSISDPAACPSMWMIALLCLIWKLQNLATLWWGTPCFDSTNENTHACMGASVGPAWNWANALQRLWGDGQIGFSTLVISNEYILESTCTCLRISATITCISSGMNRVSIERMRLENSTTHAKMIYTSLRRMLRGRTNYW